MKRIQSYGDAVSMLKEGQGKWMVRREDSNHPANTIPIPARVPLYTAEQKGKKAGDYDRFVAFFEVEITPDTTGIGPQAVMGKHQVIVESGPTRRELHKSIGFANCFSMYAPSTWYRGFREAYGWEGSIQTEEQKRESLDTSFRMLAAVLGVPS